MAVDRSGKWWTGESFDDWTCRGCGDEHLIADSDDYWEDCTPKTWRCVCGGKDANLAVGYSLYADGAEVRWIAVGQRCVSCDVMGSYVDWKIGYGPSLHLLDQA